MTNEVASPEVVYAKDTWSFQTGHNRMLLLLIPS